MLVGGSPDRKEEGLLRALEGMLMALVGTLMTLVGMPMALAGTLMALVDRLQKVLALTSQKGVDTQEMWGVGGRMGLRGRMGLCGTMGLCGRMGLWTAGMELSLAKGRQGAGVEGRRRTIQAGSMEALLLLEVEPEGRLCQAWRAAQRVEFQLWGGACQLAGQALDGLQQQQQWRQRVCSWRHWCAQTPQSAWSAPWHNFRSHLAPHDVKDFCHK
mmetsp:Transcript_26233/g.70970  ORF Transcript_26233/g.70970 Transcript_26233/m.70970 type:complete len:215 (-) Transcript_26233:906-1550(-)